VCRACRWALVFVLQTAVYAQEKCSAEVKLLVSPEQTQKVLTVLHAGKEVSGQVYLFDTDDLDLLSRGVTIRLRTGAKNDLTVKLRFSEPEGTNLPARPTASKCEIDMVGNVALTSYTLTKVWKNEAVPKTGAELRSAFTTDQMKLLRAVTSIDWDKLKRQADLRATAWDAHPDSPISKISIELWEWPGDQILESPARAQHQILELSARTSRKNGTLSLRELRALAERSGLTVGETQEAKTTLILHALR